MLSEVLFLGLSQKGKVQGACLDLRISDVRLRHGVSPSRHRVVNSVCWNKLRCPENLHPELP